MLQKKGLKNPFIVGKSAKIKPTSINNIIAIVNNVIKKMAMFLIIAFLPLMLIAVIIIVIIAAIMTIFAPDTINNLTTAHVSELLIKSNEIASDSGGDAPSWLLSSIMNAVSAILYLIFIKPLLWLLNKFQDIIYFMSGGNLANRLLFENNNPNGVPMLFIVMVAIAGIILALLLAGRMIEIMLADEKHIKLKATLRNMILLFIVIPIIPIIFFTLNIIVNLLTQAIMQASNFNMQNIGLFIFNSSFDNGMHNFDYVPASWTFADIEHFNYLMCLFSEGFMIYIFLLISLFLFWRTAELLILYVLSPIVIVSAIQDEGRRFKNWKELTVARFLSFNIVFLTYSLFLWSITIFAEIGNAIPNPTTRPIFTLLGIFAFGIVVVKSPQLLSSLMGGNTSLSAGSGNIMGLKVATNAFITGGAMVTSGVRNSYSLSKKTAGGMGVARAVHQGAKEHGFKNIAKAKFKNTVTSDFVKSHAKTSEKINQWFNDK
ncbi:Mbov_0396 family ICE element transmembrane protein [Spiroplasma endosymbiont of 'Nebria riversi']|uniref:Mbov_0396 family ICE element transmembrane protein n=1 Tax=Spiroplasma endosymbiont of 'Nebria riversi' TaxID=2792084 RepID=UPI001C059AD2|nr:hypothetical protein [Spiroplasma endosymbiont of 'Nebria riversi']